MLPGAIQKNKSGTFYGSRFMYIKWHIIL